jgi:ABC-type bacteriocin/lantibiotic exporter with double-glycine peptidase domain
MKPARFFLPLSTLLLRLSILFYLYVAYFETILNLNYKSPDFYLASLLSIFGVLLFIGRFIQKQTLTVLSSLVLFLIGLYKVFSYSGSLTSFGFVSLIFFVLVVFFFLCKGNRN